MDERYNHAPNDSPRSGGSKKVTPVVWGAIVAVIVALAIWFTMNKRRRVPGGLVAPIDAKYPEDAFRNDFFDAALPYR